MQTVQSTFQFAVRDPGPLPRIVTPTDSIPNFGAFPSKVASRSGNWSDASMWSPTGLPATGDIVQIPAGLSVVYDVLATAKLNTVSVLGTLSFLPNIVTELHVTHFMVLAGGTLAIGTDAAPITGFARVVINDVPLDLTNDPEQFGNGLIVIGTFMSCGAQERVPFIECAVEPLKNATTLTLASPCDWKVGDSLLLPDTRQFITGLAWTQLEKVTVSAVSADGLTITLAAPLAFDHFNDRTTPGVTTFRPHAINLTRPSVLFQSENPSGVRGHIMFTMGAMVDGCHGTYLDLGRTTNALLDLTTFNADGTVKHIGTNQKGRYAVHFHHVMSMATSGDAFKFDHNVILTSVPTKWGMSVHGSHYGLIQANVVYNYAGWGIGTEDGTETGNVFDGNFCIGISGLGDDGDQRINTTPPDFGYEGAGFWFQAPNNFVRNNWSANCKQYGYHYYSVMHGNPAATFVNLPVSQGSSTTVSTLLAAIPIKEFTNNGVYGVTKEGLMLWSIGAPTGPDIVTTIARSPVLGYKSWGLFMGIRCYPLNNFLIDGWVHRGTWAVAQSNGSYGFGCSDYTVANMTFNNCDIQGVTYAINPPTAQSTAITGQVPQTMFIQNSTLRAIRGIPCFSLSKGSSNSFDIAPRRIEIDNVTFLPDPTNVTPKYTIGMNYRPGSSNIIQLDQVFVRDYNGVVGDNFQVYYTQQTASFVVPITGATVDSGGPIKHGATVAGLTNQQNWDQYGIAIAGAVAPANATTQTGIAGLVSR